MRLKFIVFLKLLFFIPSTNNKFTLSRAVNNLDGDIKKGYSGIAGCLSHAPKTISIYTKENSIFMRKALSLFLSLTILVSIIVVQPVNTAMSQEKFPYTILSLSSDVDVTINSMYGALNCKW